MTFPRNLIKLGTAQTIFPNFDIAAHNSIGDRILPEDTISKVTSYSALKPGANNPKTRITDTGLTHLCQRIVERLSRPKG